MSIFFASVCISFSFPKCYLWLLLMTHPLANFNRAFQSIPGRRSLVMLRWLSMLCSCDHSVDLLELSPLWFKQPKLSSIKYLCMKLGNSFLSIDLCSLADHNYFNLIKSSFVSHWSWVSFPSLWNPSWVYPLFATHFWIFNALWLALHSSIGV